MVIQTTSQCPLEGGPAVSIARGLLSLSQPDIYYDDASNCIVGGSSIQLGDMPEVQQAHFSLHPNPANHSIQVSLEENSEEQVAWEIYDMSGRLILSGVIEEDVATYHIDISLLAKGTYYLRATGNKTISETRRFIKN